MTALRTSHRLVLAALAALALLVAGCGGGGTESAVDKAAAQADKEAKNRKPVAAAKPITSATVKPSAGEADIAKKPTVAKGTGAPPTALKAETLIAGSGAAITDGQQATVQYVGVLFSNGKEFDTSWGKGKQPFQFALGGGQVIPGWDQGVLGMKVGERRRLTIPSDLAYGAQGSPPKIPANAPLIFDIDLKKIG
jgi:peptidylprolyl isomerase